MSIRLGYLWREGGRKGGREGGRKGGREGDHITSIVVIKAVVVAVTTDFVLEELEGKREVVQLIS